MSEQYVRVPRELLERLISATKTARGEGSPTQRYAEALLAAPPEDVRAGVDEPAGNEKTVYLILFDDYDVRPETVIGENSARQRYAQLSNSWNAHLFVKLDSNSRDDAQAKSNYRDPQRPMVFPVRPYADDDEQSRMTEYEIGLGHGAMEMWDKIAELNK